MGGDKCWIPGWEKRLDWVLRTTPFWHHQPGIEKWDTAEYRPHGDVMLQTVDEFVGLVEFFAANNIRSYLEIGTWTGRLISALHYIFQFDRIYAMDILEPATDQSLPMRLPIGTNLYVGYSTSADGVAWRRSLGHIDFVMIDGDHSYEGVRRDFEIQSSMPHRFLGFHDLIEPWEADPSYRCEVWRLWRELEGRKTEIIRPVREIGLDHALLGIGIWAKE